MTKVSKILFHASWLSSVYFLLLLLNNYIIKSDVFLIGFIQELATIPIMFAQFGLCVAALIYWIKDSFRLKEYSFYTVVISFCNIAFIVLSFTSW
ncbi:hypothetical protein [Pedobacter insulae]|uniref:Uncharacterized protein n=1 Tax=Pedobacter insulae TaxID=414048 RepID=A0A1I2Y2P5_9SPHI|nr:hypothetical protein [Pedobacter insulae]SFH19629.1 hypothetical protein SAMN04489864_106175 [Pedobacter insulae]